MAGRTDTLAYQLVRRSRRKARPSPGIHSHTCGTPARIACSDPFDAFRTRPRRRRIRSRITRKFPLRGGLPAPSLRMQGDRVRRSLYRAGCIQSFPSHDRRRGIWTHSGHRRLHNCRMRKYRTGIDRWPFDPPFKVGNVGPASRKPEVHRSGIWIFGASHARLCRTLHCHRSPASARCASGIAACRILNRAVRHNGLDIPTIATSTLHSVRHAWRKCRHGTDRWARRGERRSPFEYHAR